MSQPLDLRVTLLETWEETRLSVPANTLVSELKRSILAGSRIRRSPLEYMVKYRGAELGDAETLAGAGVPSNGALIVLPRRRVPVR